MNNNNNNNNNIDPKLHHNQQDEQRTKAYCLELHTHLTKKRSRHQKEENLMRLVNKRWCIQEAGNEMHNNWWCKSQARCPTHGNCLDCTMKSGSVSKLCDDCRLPQGFEFIHLPWCTVERKIPCWLLCCSCYRCFMLIHICFQLLVLYFDSSRLTLLPLHGSLKYWFTWSSTCCNNSSS